MALFDLPLEELHWANAGYAQFVVDSRGQDSMGGSGATPLTRTAPTPPTPAA